MCVVVSEQDRPAIVGGAMKKVCCTALWDALMEGRLEWTPVSEGDAAGPIVVGEWTDWGFLPLFWCPNCGAEI